MSTLVDWLNRLPRLLTAVGCLAMVLAVGVIDYWTDIEFSVAMLYLLPVSLAAWRLGRTMGLVVGFLCVAVWITVDLLGMASVGYPYGSIGNAVMLEVAFTVAAFLVSAMHDNVEFLQRAVAVLHAEVEELEDAGRKLKVAEAKLTKAAGAVKDRPSLLRTH